MTSLRVALKLSMAESASALGNDQPGGGKKRSDSFIDEFLELPAGRRRKSSLGKDPSSGAQETNTTVNSSSSSQPANKKKSVSSGKKGKSPDEVSKEQFCEESTISSSGQVLDDANSVTSAVALTAEELDNSRPPSRSKGEIKAFVDSEDNDLFQINPSEPESLGLERDGKGTKGLDDAPAMEEVNADDNNAEEEEGVSSPKKRKKRVSSLLKGLEMPILPMDNNDGDDDGEDAPRKSSRAAALVAKTKLNVTTTNRQRSSDSLADNKVDDSTTTPVSSRKRPGQKPKAAATQWVQCDKCSKWRAIAAHIRQEDLPNIWYCSMNDWDSLRNNCSAEEELEGEVASPVPPKVVSETSEKLSAVKGKGRWANRGVKKAEQGDSEDEAKPGVKQELTEQQKAVAAANRRRAVNNRTAANRGSSAGAQPSAVPSEASAVPAVNWVMCNKCSKWRKVPESISIDVLPDVWYCSMNTWNPQVARCTARQEEDNEEKEKEKERRSTAAANIPEVVKPSTSAVNAFRSRKPAQQGALPIAIVKKTQWVQCERKNCKKWRKVPGYIDLESLPDKWYCEMNTWNPDTATCDAAQDSDSDDDDAKSAAARNNLILGNAKGANALSYRRIIFGTDGRIRGCFSEKNKIGNGIFTHPVTARGNIADETAVPVRRVTYWWSTVHDDKLQSISNATNSGPAPTYMLDALRRVYNFPVPSTALSSHTSVDLKMASKSSRLLARTTLIHRQRAECTLVRSCFLACLDNYVLFTSLFDIIQTSRFLNPLVEACRQFMTMSVFVQVLRRMEMQGEIEVCYTAQMQLVVCLLTPMDTLKSMLASRRDKYNKLVNPNEHDNIWSSAGYPLKLRKFLTKYSTDPDDFKAVEEESLMDGAEDEIGEDNGDKQSMDDDEEEQEEEIGEHQQELDNSLGMPQPIQQLEESSV